MTGGRLSRETLELFFVHPDEHPTEQSLKDDFWILEHRLKSFAIEIPKG